MNNLIIYICSLTIVGFVLIGCESENKGKQSVTSTDLIDSVVIDGRTVEKEGGVTPSGFSRRPVIEVFLKEPVNTASVNSKDKVLLREKTSAKSENLDFKIENDNKKLTASLAITTDTLNASSIYLFKLMPGLTFKSEKVLPDTTAYLFTTVP